MSSPTVTNATLNVTEAQMLNPSFDYTSQSFVFNFVLNMMIAGVLMLIFLAYRKYRQDMKTLGK